MIEPALLNLYLRTNSPYDQIFGFVESGEPVDLTGYTIEMEVKRSPTGATLATITPTVQTPSADGQWLLSIPATTIDSIYDDVVTNANNGQPITVQHDVILTKDGVGRVWLVGTITIEKGITNG